IDGGVVALPGTGQTYVAQVALLDRDGKRAAAVRNVMPHETAGPSQVHRLGQYERGHVSDFAVRVFTEFDVLNDPVGWGTRIEFAKSAAGNLLVRDGL